MGLNEEKGSMEPAARELLEVLKDFQGYLSWQREGGLLGLNLPVSGKGDAAVSPQPLDLEGIRAWIGDCRRCKLWQERKNIVFGSGNREAALVLVGEGPGAEEDEAGEPFVGKAGQLLTKIIESIDLKRDQVYICNIIKCRPPQNRNPQPDEIEACKPFLLAQLKSLSPKLICALGTFAARTLLQTSSPISALRGRFHQFQGIPLLATFHPAYLLRNPTEKRKVWEDMKLLKQEYERPTDPSS
jgi:uracil-DNA glycosylase